MITLTENPELVEHYLNELSADIDGSCQEMRSTILGPLRICAKLLQVFHLTQRGRTILKILHNIIDCTERMITYWETKPSEITETLRGEREYKLPKGPIAIG